MIKIESVFVGAVTGGRLLGSGLLYADKEIFKAQRDAMAERAKQARRDGNKGRIEVRR